MDIFIRQNNAIPIIRKILPVLNQSFSQIVSPRKAFGLGSDFKSFQKNEFPNSVRLYKVNEQVYVDKKHVFKRKDWIELIKIFTVKATGDGKTIPSSVISKPFIVKRNTCCTETYLIIGPCKSLVEAENILSYMKCRFFRFLVMLKKNTQNMTRGTFDLVPLQDFNEPWDDAKIYDKYKLSNEDIAFIESTVKPMN